MRRQRNGKGGKRQLQNAPAHRQSQGQRQRLSRGPGPAALERGGRARRRHRFSSVGAPQKTALSTVSSAKEQQPDQQQCRAHARKAVFEDESQEPRDGDLLLVGDGLDHEIGAVADVGSGAEEDRAEADGQNIGVLEAPVVPSRFAIIAPKSRKRVLSRGVARPPTPRCMPPATTKSEPMSTMKLKYSWPASSRRSGARKTRR